MRTKRGVALCAVVVTLLAGEVGAVPEESACPDRPEGEPKVHALPIVKLGPVTSIPPAPSGFTNVKISVRYARPAKEGDSVHIRFWDSGNVLAGSIPLKYGQTPSTVQFKAGTYRIDVTVVGGSDVWDLQSRYAVVSGRRVLLPIHVGRRGQATYHLGASLLPFEARQKQLFLFLRSPLTSIERTEKFVESLRRALVEPLLRPTTMGEYEASTKALSQSVVWRLGFDVSSKRRENWDSLRELLHAVGSFGIPLNEGGGGDALHQARYVVRSSDAKQFVLEKCMRVANARRVRFLSRDKRLLMVEFLGEPDLLAIEPTVREWVAKGIAEAAQLSVGAVPGDDQDLAANWPNDGAYGEQRQGNHGIHRVRSAWAALNLQARLSLGREAETALHVASYDAGVRLDDRDVACVALGREATMVESGECLDAGTGALCGAGGHELTFVGSGPQRNMHGMGIFGVMSACTDNSDSAGGYLGQVAGIAPGVRHVAVKRPTPITADAIGDALLWMGGLGPECAGDHGGACDWPPPVHGARVINVSQSLPSPLHEGVDPYIEYVLGRLNEATSPTTSSLVVFSAGNNNKYRDEGGIFSDARVYVVANCETSESGGQRRHAENCSGSAYGPVISACAIGRDVPTLAKFCDTGNGAPLPSYCRMTGTSPAAATATSIAALVLLANPSLTAKELICVLDRTAMREALQSTSSVPEQSCNIESPEVEINCSFSAEGRSICYGSGILDAKGAVLVAMSSASADLFGCREGFSNR